MTEEELKRRSVHHGAHTTEVLSVLERELKSKESLNSIKEKATEIIKLSVDPSTDTPNDSSDGLLYGLIQSGKTSILTAAAAMAADNGFQCIVILTSDINILYDQTLERVRKALLGLSVLEKNDWKNSTRFEGELRNPPFVVVCSKNAKKLNSLLNAFKKAGAKNLSALIIDDEADQASLNTFTSKGGDEISRINEVITKLRSFFRVNTYLQATATPQALFLQRPDHEYRPSFTVLSTPGAGYVGGDQFFGINSRVLRNVSLEEVEELIASHQPSPGGNIPSGLSRALYTFLVAATVKFLQNPGVGCAFLCHVSVNKKDHEHIVALIARFKEKMINILKNQASSQYAKVVDNLKIAYDDFSNTQSDLPKFQLIEERIKLYIHGTNIKLINASSNEEIKLDSVYNIFVGGNKLGRGVTIKNLLVSYYGRNPKRPNADTVLQHARMYGYRQNDIGLTRLFLPETLAERFRLIHQMESALRDLVHKYPRGKFEGLYIAHPLRATRSNVLDPNSIGMYVAGGYCNPRYPLRTQNMIENTQWLDKKLEKFDDTSDSNEVTIDLLIQLIQKCQHDPDKGAELWNTKIIIAALEKLKSLYGNKAYLLVRRDRDLNVPRNETQGFLSGGEDALLPRDAPGLFLYRLKRNFKGVEVWWPLIRFLDGNYVLAFSFD